MNIGNTKHGKYYSQEYRAYYAMRNRCLNPNFHSYHRYGGRGIKICARWLESFGNFYKDMGRRPIGFSLERIDNDLGYSPENCKWASRAEQSANMHRFKKLSEAAALEIRSLVKEGRLPYWRIGERFGVSASLVCNIAKGKAWNQ